MQLVDTEDMGKVRGLRGIVTREIPPRDASSAIRWYQIFLEVGKHWDVRADKLIRKYDRPREFFSNADLEWRKTADKIWRQLHERNDDDENS